MAKKQPPFVLDKEKLKTKEGWMEFYDHDWLPWHSSELNKALLDNVDSLVKSARKDNAPRDQVRYFVPLCGCSLDMIYLYDQGFTVIGIDIVEENIKKVTELSNGKLKMSKRTINRDYSVFETEDRRLQFIIGDYFNLTTEILGGKVDCVWDRNALCAVDLSFRAKYADVISSLVNDDFGYLLYSIERENPLELPSEMPHSFTYEDADELFKDKFNVQLIGQELKKEPKQDEEIDESDPLCRRVEKFNTFLMTKWSVRLGQWSNRWATNDINIWHIDFVNPTLQKYYLDLTGGKSGLNFLFPLCGKAVEMKWIYDEGHIVVGIEGIISPVEQFFKESGIKYTRTRRSEFNCWMYKSANDDGRLTIFVCDLFDMTPELLGKSIDCIWDRGSYMAIYKEDRKRYIKLLLSFNAPQFKHLLETRQYDETAYDGIPRNSDEGEIENFYREIAGEKVKVTCLESELLAPNPRFNDVSMDKVTFMIESP